MGNKKSNIIVPVSLINPEYNEVSFTVPGKPFGKQRPRVTNRGKFATAYTPKETVNYENLVKISYSVSGNQKLDGPIEANIKAYYPIPTSISNKQKQILSTESTPALKKPDVDNIAKVILDPLNCIAYNDDSQVYKLCVEKYYSNNPRVDVTLKMMKVIGIHNG